MSKLRPEISIATLNAQGGEYLPGYLGIEMTDLAPNSLRSRMPVKKLHFAPNDFLHAASIVALADTTCGYATIAHLPEGAQSFTTIELKIETAKPINKVVPKPWIAEVPKNIRIKQVKIVEICPSLIEGQARRKPSSKACRTDFPAFISSQLRAKIKI